MIKLKMGDKSGAVAAATEGLELAKKKPNAEYMRVNTEVLTAASR